MNSTERGAQFHVTRLVDNTAKLGSRLWAEHGSAFLIETAEAKVLFDTGQSGDVLAHNLAVLEKDLQDLSAVVLSHGHYDHTGGLGQVLSMAGNVEIVAHPDIFNERVARDDRAVDKQIGIPFSQKFLEASCRLRLTSEPVEVAKGIVTTGQVPRGFGPEPRDARLLVREGDRLAADPLLDDMSLVLTAGDGLVVLFGCCHAGIINTLEHVTRLFNAAVMTVMGGTHLAHADDVVLRESVLAVKHRYGARNAYVGHCTGTRGLLAFAEVFGEHGSACPSGLTCEF